MPSRFEFAGTKQLLRLLDAVMAIGSELNLADSLRRITQSAADLVDAQYAALGVLDESGSRLTEFVTIGLDDEQTRRIGARPEGHGILGLLILDPQPLRLPDLNAHPDSFGFPPGHPPMTSFLGVPIRLRDVVYGNLYLTDKADGQVFTDVDQELAVGLAAAAGIAIENARLHEQARTAVLADERERIARDLHDDVIQRLFATGLSLQAAAAQVAEPATVERIMHAVDDLDVSIRQIRSTIFELHQQWSTSTSLRSDILAVCDESAAALGFRPSCDIDGPIDSTRWGNRRGATCCCVFARACRTSPGTHGRAMPTSPSPFETDMSCSPSPTTGSGSSSRTTEPSSGLDNIRVRAQTLGGEFTIDNRTTGGTITVWDVPLG